MDTCRILGDLPCVRRIRVGNPDRVAWYRLVVGERSAIRRPRRVCARNQLAARSAEDGLHDRGDLAAFALMRPHPDVCAIRCEPDGTDVRLEETIGPAICQVREMPAADLCQQDVERPVTIRHERDELAVGGNGGVELGALEVGQSFGCRHRRAASRAASPGRRGASARVRWPPLPPLRGSRHTARRDGSATRTAGRLVTRLSLRSSPAAP